MDPNKARLEKRFSDLLEIAANLEQQDKNLPEGTPCPMRERREYLALGYRLSADLLATVLRDWEDHPQHVVATTMTPEGVEEDIVVHVGSDLTSISDVDWDLPLSDD